METESRKLPVIVKEITSVMSYLTRSLHYPGTVNNSCANPSGRGCDHFLENESLDTLMLLNTGS